MGKLDGIAAIEAAQTTAGRLRETIANHARQQVNSACDKIGLGWNLDGRFSSWSIKLSLDSWRGYYGNSSCSTSVHVASQEVFSEAFLAVMNREVWQILEKVAAEIEKQAAKHLEPAIAEARERLARLEALADSAATAGREA